MQDEQLMFCHEQSLPTTSGTHIHSTDAIYIPAVVDHKGAAMDDRPFTNGKLYWNCTVEGEDMLAAVDGAVVTFYLYNGATGTQPLIDNSGVVVDTVVITENTPSEHPDGTLLFSRALPQGQYEAYWDVYVTVGTQNISTGKITSWFGPPAQQG